MDVVRIELTLSMLSVILLCSSITSLSLSFLSASKPPTWSRGVSLVLQRCLTAQAAMQRRSLSVTGRWSM